MRVSVRGWAVYATRSRCETDLVRYEECAEVDWCCGAFQRQHLVWTNGGHWSWGLERRSLVMATLKDAPIRALIGIGEIGLFITSSAGRHSYTIHCVRRMGIIDIDHE